LLPFTTACLLAIGACSTEATPGGTASGGSTQSGSGGSSTGSGGAASGGTTGSASGGTTGSASGGTTGTASGGTTGSASGGTTGTASGGTTGTASGGVTGSGGSDTGSGGSDTGSGGAAGGRMGSGGGNTGNGGRGTTASGGSSMGGATAASGGTMGGGGSSGGTPTISDLFPKGTNMGSFHGRLMVVPCGEANTQGTDCVNGGGYYSTAGDTTTQRIMCSGGAFKTDQVFPVGGEAGKTYKVTIHVYGISEPKDYGTGVTREATGRPGFQDTGSMPTPWATAKGGHTYPDSDYNTMELRVCKTRACMTADETDVYYLNADSSQGHWTFVLNYEKQINVVGGGSIRVKQYDRNCKQIKNCGTDGTPNSMCAQVSMKRIIDLANANPKPASGPASGGGLLQPNLVSERQATDSGQWNLINVIKVE